MFRLTGEEDCCVKDYCVKDCCIKDCCVKGRTYYKRDTIRRRTSTFG